MDIRVPGVFLHQDSKRKLFLDADIRQRDDSSCLFKIFHQNMLAGICALVLNQVIDFLLIHFYEGFTMLPLSNQINEKRKFN